MARVTIEDCLNDSVDNRFKLVMLAAKRARHLSLSGEEPHLDWENDKCTVVALREIAAGKLDMEYLDQETQQALMPKPKNTEPEAGDTPAVPKTAEQ